MFIGWLTCISAVLLPHSLCRFTTANAPANRQMPIASVVSGSVEKKEKDSFLADKHSIKNKLNCAINQEKRKKHASRGKLELTDFSIY